MVCTGMELHAQANLEALYTQKLDYTRIWPSTHSDCLLCQGASCPMYMMQLCFT